MSGYVDQDLRDMLHASVAEAPDVSDFRRRLDRALTARAQAERAGLAQPDQPDEPEEISVMTLPQRLVEQRRPHRRLHLLGAAALAACIAAIALAVALVPGHHRPTPATSNVPDPFVTVPANVRGMLVPGSVPLRNFAGVGPRLIDLGEIAAVRDHSFALYGTCARGLLGISGEGSTECAGTFGMGVSAAHRRVLITVRAGVTWRLLLVLQPNPDTNASLYKPSGTGTIARARDYLLHDQHGVWHQSGSGDATLRLPAAQLDPKGVTQLQLVCSGTGLRLSTTDGQIRNDYTHTCFAGWVYTWQPSKFHLPTTLTVSADPATTWTIELVTM